MPKVIVLVSGADDAASSLGVAAADGAKSVRFTEVDVRSTGADASRHARVASAHAVTHYDGVVIATASGATDDALMHLLDELAREREVSTTVFGVAAGDAGLAERVSRLGGVVVSQRAGADGDAAEQARLLGVRVAKVAGWVRHGLGHEAEHQHAHHHHDASSGHAH